MTQTIENGVFHSKEGFGSGMEQQEQWRTPCILHANPQRDHDAFF